MGGISSLMIASLLCAAVVSAPVQDAAVRRVTFVTNAYASFSPDGSKVAYQGNASGNYDLYTFEFGKELPALKILITGPGNDITPNYSPDGKKLAFVSDRDGNREVYVCDADGSNQVNVTKTAGNDIHPAWSTDSKKLIFSSNRGNDEDDFDIYEMAADGSGVKRLTSGPEIDTYASWSPDGRQIVTRRVLGEDSEVFMMNADGSNPRNLTNAPTFDGWPVWSPDGKWIAYSSGPEADPAGANADMHVYLMKPDGSGKKALTMPPSGTTWIYDTQSNFSFDGKRLVFTRYRPGVYESAEICFVDM